MAIIFSDDFTRADNDAPGGNWVEQGGTDWDIESNSLIPRSHDVAYILNTSSLGTADYAVEAWMTFLSGTGGSAIIGRVTDLNNFYRVWCGSGHVPGGAFQLYKCVAGTFTALGSVVNVDGSPAKVKLSMQGTTIKMFVNDVERASVTDSAHSAEGDFGFMTYDADLTIRSFDDCFVYDFIGGGIFFQAGGLDGGIT